MVKISSQWDPDPLKPKPKKTDPRSLATSLLEKPSILHMYHGAPKPTFLEFFMVNNLVFRWSKPLFFMVLGAHGIHIARGQKIERLSNLQMRELSLPGHILGMVDFWDPVL